MKYLLGTALTLGLITPALSQQFYIVQSPATKECTVVTQRPADSSVVVMGGGKVYTSRDEAQTAVKEVCTTSTTGGGSTTTIVPR